MNDFIPHREYETPGSLALTTLEGFGQRRAYDRLAFPPAKNAMLNPGWTRSALATTRMRLSAA
jgi:hypothetical protein